VDMSGEGRKVTCVTLPPVVLTVLAGKELDSTVRCEGASTSTTKVACRSNQHSSRKPASVDLASWPSGQCRLKQQLRASICHWMSSPVAIPYRILLVSRMPVRQLQHPPESMFH